PKASSTGRRASRWRRAGRIGRIGRIGRKDELDELELGGPPRLDQSIPWWVPAAAGLFCRGMELIIRIGPPSGGPVRFLHAEVAPCKFVSNIAQCETTNHRPSV